MRVLALPLLFALLLATVRAAASAPIDLGEGLLYLRVTDADSVTTLKVSSPLVLDLRRARSETPEEASGLATLLRAEGPVRFVLVSRETAPAVRHLLATRAPAVVTLAAGSVELSPDFAVNAAPDEDLRAYDAYDNGAELANLIQPPIQKNRRDEAAIIRSRANGNGNGNGNNAAATEDPPAEAAAEPAEPLLVDVVLQRAVHLHRGLKALGRL